MKREGEGRLTHDPDQDVAISGKQNVERQAVRSQLSQLLAAVSSLYLLAPAFIFAFGWLRLRFMIIELLVLGVMVLALLREIYILSRGLLRSAGPLNPLRLTGKSAVGVAAGILILGAWALLSGAGGFGYQNPDYSASNALLRDLIVRDWPLKLGSVYSQKYIVYYTGYYLPAAALGKALGWNAANYFILIWTLLGVALAFAWFVNLTQIRFGRNPLRLPAVAAYFCLVGGLDVIGWYLIQRHAFDLTRPIEWWATYFQYSSNTTLLYWVPQHALAAWIVTGMVALALLDSANVRFVGAAWAASVLWSPFGDLGIVPFLVPIVAILLGSRNGRAVLFSRASILLNGLSLWIAAVHLSYILANSLRVDSGPIWEFVQAPVLLPTLVEFWLIEFALLAGLVMLYLGPRLPSRAAFWGHRPRSKETEGGRGEVPHPSSGQFVLFLISAALLFVLPLYRVGFYDDIVMRGSIPALFIFWAFVGKIIFDSVPRPPIRLAVVRLLIIAIVLGGFFPAVDEITRSIAHFQVGPPDVTQVLTLADESPRDERQRVGFSSAFFFRYLAK